MNSIPETNTGVNPSPSRPHQHDPDEPTWRDHLGEILFRLRPSRHVIHRYPEREAIKRAAWEVIDDPQAPEIAKAHAAEAIVRCWWDRSREFWRRQGWKGHPSYARYLRAVVGTMGIPDHAVRIISAGWRSAPPLKWLPGESVVAPDWREADRRRNERQERTRRRGRKDSQRRAVRATGRRAA